MNNNDPKKMCGCNTIFDIDSGLKTLAIDLESYKIKANKRLDYLVNVFCLKCGANRHKPEINANNKGIFDFKVLKIKSSTIVNDEKDKDISKNKESKSNNKNESKSNNKNEKGNKKEKEKENKNENENENKNEKEKEKEKEKENEKEYISECDHVICQSCIEDFVRSLISKQNNNIKSKNIKDNNSIDDISRIYCNICEYEHSCDMKPVINSMKKNACCQNGCLIY
jgi:cobalamin biosynthesis protein CobT